LLVFLFWEARNGEEEQAAAKGSSLLPQAWQESPHGCSSTTLELGERKELGKVVNFCEFVSHFLS